MPQMCAAQVLYGSLVGNVEDPSGAAIPGATVILTQKETRFSRETATDQGGNYTLPTTPAGPYEVKVSNSGFKTFTRADVPVTLNTLARIDVALEVGDVS